MWSFARSALRAHASSVAGSFVMVALASALLTATGAWMEAGIRGTSSGEDLSMLSAATGSFAGTTILVVVLVVASAYAAALRERRSQFALLRAVGATPTQVRRMVATEVAIVFAAATLVGAVPGLLLARSATSVLVSGEIVPAGFVLQLSPWPVLATAVLLGGTGALTARLAARETARLSPTAAVRLSATEPSTLSPVRRTAAWCCAVLGLGVAVVPFVVPGLIGSASGASSAFLLITSAALAGPAIVAALARRGLAAAQGSGSTSLALALTNARGFSRRLTAAIVPLALLLSLGTVQLGVNRAVSTAAGVQLGDGITADLVVQKTGGLGTTDLEAVRSTPGVEALTTLRSQEAQVRTDDEMDDVALLSGLAWEPTALQVLSGEDVLVDPDVRSGSLDDLAEPGTVAVGRDSLLGTGTGLGDSLTVRLDDQERELTIVAVYDRTLGFGDYLVGEATLASDDTQTGTGTAADAVLLRTAPGKTDAVETAIVAAGLDVLTPAEYADAATEAAAGQQQLSAILVLALLVFVAAAAANTLAMLASSRRPEHALLRRTGATRRQLVTTAAVEAAVVALAALVIGTASVLPALIGVGYGLVGSVFAGIDVMAFGVLALAVVLVAGATTVIGAVRATAVRRVVQVG